MEEELREQHVVETGDVKTLLKLRKHSLVNICEALELPTDGVLEEIRARLLKHFTSEKPVIEMGLGEEFERLMRTLIEGVSVSNQNVVKAISTQSQSIITLAESSRKKGAGFVKIYAFKQGEDDLENYLARFETLCEHGCCCCLSSVSLGTRPYFMACEALRYITLSDLLGDRFDIFGCFY